MTLKKLASPKTILQLSYKYLPIIQFIACMAIMILSNDGTIYPINILPPPNNTIDIVDSIIKVVEGAKFY